jgi:aspartate 1-decarboxylase
MVAARGSGEIWLNGVGARRAQWGDLVIIVTFCWMDAETSGTRSPRIVLVDEMNCTRQSHG